MEYQLVDKFWICSCGKCCPMGIGIWWQCKSWAWQHAQSTVVSMHTCSSPSQSVSNDTRVIPSKTQCDWSEKDEAELINFFFDHKFGNGEDDFKSLSAVWDEAAQHLEQFQKKGGPKTAKSCYSEWTQVHDKVIWIIDHSPTTVLAQGGL